MSAGLSLATLFKRAFSSWMRDCLALQDARHDFGDAMRAAKPGGEIKQTSRRRRWRSVIHRALARDKEKSRQEWCSKSKSETGQRLAGSVLIH
jgi:hypothetical protein